MGATNKDESRPTRRANAFDQLEGAVREAFFGEDGASRLARLKAALEDGAPDALYDPYAQAAYIAAVLTELERLGDRVRANGIVMPEKESAPPADLQGPTIVETALSLSERIRNNPALAIRAQARLSKPIVHSLTG